MVRACFVLLLALPLTVPVAATAATPASGELPSCAEGPERVGDEMLGTPCDDRIVAPPGVASVEGGPGDDVIVGANSAPVTAATGNPATGLHLEVGSQTFEGGPGNDIVFGDRGNDRLRGNAGNDRLYGGIGDDTLEGGEGDDLLSGGFGADKIDGQSGNDYVRGDATIDHIFDTGGGFDTLSFATGATPGFTAASNPTGAASFPGPSGERGVWLKLNEGGNNAVDGEPSLGGGNDEVQPDVFERIIGSPFSDYIVGSSRAEEIWGGGGADVIEGGGGADAIHGGADGDLLIDPAGAALFGEGGEDSCEGGATANGCEPASGDVDLRNPAQVSVGETTGASGLTQVYLVGSSGNDTVSASYGGSGNVEFTLSGSTFENAAAEPGRCSISATTASCPVSGLLDSVLLAGMDGSDTISAVVPDGVDLVVLGGAGVDALRGGAGGDVLVDGPGSSADQLHAEAGDDALTHNGGADLLDGGEGSDLFLQVSICDSETVDGGIERVGAPTPDRDNASWARLGGIGVDARLDQGRAGEIGPGEQPECAGGAFDALTRIEDLEASNQSDVLYGNEGNNQLLGHKGEDTYFALGGDDSILANSGSRDRIINCGPGLDQAIVDFVSKAVDPTPIECENVREGAPEEFNELPLLTQPPVTPPPPPPPPPPKPPVDRTAPRTKLLRHPPKLIRVAPGHHKLIAFRFVANESASFRCKLDGKPFAPCRSPRKYRLGPGRHAFRLFAVDAAGNRDRTPALFRFRVVANRPHKPANASR